MTKGNLLQLIKDLQKQALSDLLDAVRTSTILMVSPEVLDMYEQYSNAMRVESELRARYESLLKATYPELWKDIRYSSLRDSTPLEVVASAVTRSAGFMEKTEETRQKFAALYNKVDRTKNPDKLLEMANLLGIDVGGEITGVGVDVKGIDVPFLKQAIRHQKVIAGGTT